MNNSKLTLDTCGCCEGVEKLTPIKIHNDHGLETILYRTGTHSEFKESMIKGLSESALLKDLTIREDDDSTIALMDVWAMILDVLTFYNERIINEGYILTSTERLSLVELARHISYIPKPGVAAGSWFSFLTEESPGAPTEAKVENGTRVQSIPGQDEKAQIFETIEEILAKTKWNKIRPKLTQSQEFNKGLKRIYLKGTSLQLQAGDKILLVGSHRLENSGSERWDYRTIENISISNDDNHTEVSWRVGLGHESPNIHPANDTRVYVFKQRAALFGYNAPDFKTMSKAVKISFNGKGGNTDTQWDNFPITLTSVGQTIYLDAYYPKILTNSWLLFDRPGYSELYKANSAKASARTDFALTSKSSEIVLDTKENLHTFQRRETVVWTQSEELELAETPIFEPIFGSTIELIESYPHIIIGQKLIISGEIASYLQVTSRDTIMKSGFIEDSQYRELLFVLDDSTVVFALKENELLEVLSVPERISDNELKWFVKYGILEGSVVSGPDDLIPYIEGNDSSKVELPSSLNQPQIVSELIEIEENDSDQLILKEALSNVYLRHTVVINANVAQATHGESKTEILGSGNGATSFQKFYLKQKPLTYISSTSPTGIETTLEVRVDDIKWKEVSTFYNTSSEERIYITRCEDDGTTYIQFGDGITGARLSTGVENIVATYRVGIGLEGILKPNQLSLLMTPQLGVKSVLNPMATSGAENPEALERIRYNAPLTVLTLDRIVSISDYTDFTSAFAGIGKARADLLWKGEDRTIHLTVASADEGPIDSTLEDNLTNAIDGARHDNYPIVINSFEETLFDVKAKIKIHPDYLEDKVISSVQESLIANYNFESRSFGQVVTPSEIIATMQSVEGVVAVDLDKLNGQNPFSAEHFRLVSSIAKWESDAIKPAELLLIDENNIDITLFE